MAENMDIRIAAKEHGVPLWRVALSLGISEMTLHRWLRVPLAEERKTTILGAIRDLSKGAC